MLFQHHDKHLEMIHINNNITIYIYIYIDIDITVWNEWEYMLKQDFCYYSAPD